MRKLVRSLVSVKPERNRLQMLHCVSETLDQGTALKNKQGPSPGWLDVVMVRVKFTKSTQTGSNMLSTRRQKVVEMGPKVIPGCFFLPHVLLWL